MQSHYSNLQTQLNDLNEVLDDLKKVEEKIQRLPSSMKALLRSYPATADKAREIEIPTPYEPAPKDQKITAEPSKCADATAAVAGPTTTKKRSRPRTLEEVRAQKAEYQRAYRRRIKERRMRTPQTATAAPNKRILVWADGRKKEIKRAILNILAKDEGITCTRVAAGIQLLPSITGFVSSETTELLLLSLIDEGKVYRNRGPYKRGPANPFLYSLTIKGEDSLRSPQAR